jgi:hypothetical protein
MHPKFQAMQSAKQFARLLGLVESHHEAVLKDPIQYLDKAGAEIARLRLILEEVEHALSGASVTYERTETVEYRSIESVLMERVQKAQKKLKDWRSPVRR